VEDLRVQVQLEQDRQAQLDKETGKAISSNMELFAEELALKQELDTAQALMHNLDRLVTKETAESASDVKVEALRRGFQAYVCCFADRSQRPVSTSVQAKGGPQKPSKEPYSADDGVYKRRHLTVSQCNGVLMWRAVGLFSQKNATLKFKDVSSTRDGSPDVIRLQPFAGYVYLTLYSNHLTLIVAVEPQLSFYLDAIKQLHLSSHNKALRSIPQSSPVIILRNAKEHLSTQSSQLQRFLSRYTTSLEVRPKQESICSLKGTVDEYQEEVQQLRDLCAGGLEGYFSGCAEDYLRKERDFLQQRLLSLSEIVARVAEHFN
jgi:hypothetical protein